MQRMDAHKMANDKQALIIIIIIIIITIIIIIIIIITSILKKRLKCLTCYIQCFTEFTFSKIGSITFFNSEPDYIRENKY